MALEPRENGGGVMATFKLRLIQLANVEMLSVTSYVKTAALSWFQIINRMRG